MKRGVHEMFRGKYLFFKRCERCFWDRSSSIGCEAGPRTSWIIQHNWSVNIFLLSFYFLQKIAHFYLIFFCSVSHHVYKEMIMTTLTTKTTRTQPSALWSVNVFALRELHSYFSGAEWVALSLKRCLWASLSGIGISTFHRTRVWSLSCLDSCCF